jgi:hypothetical protein
MPCGRMVYGRIAGWFVVKWSLVLADVLKATFTSCHCERALGAPSPDMALDAHLPFPFDTPRRAKQSPADKLFSTFIC